MKANRFTVLCGLWLLVTVLLVMGGCSKHYVDFYIRENCTLVYLDTGPEAVIDPVVVYNGDYVIFNNLKSTTITLTFPVGMFEVDSIDVVGNGRVIVKVIGADLSTGDLGIAGDCTAGSPAVKVGEGP